MSRRPRGRHKDLSVGAALEKALRDLGIAETLQRQLAIEVWDEAVGPELAMHSRALRWQGDALLVEVDDAVWAQQLSLLRQPLIQAVNRRLNRPLVKSLRFINRGRPLDKPQRRSRRIIKRELTPEEARWFDEVVCRQDESLSPELAATMARWLKAQLFRRPPAETWKQCRECRAPLTEEAGDERCPACRLEWRAHGVRGQTARRLFQAPWLDFEAVAAAVPGIDRSIYDQAKETLRADWKRILDQAQAQLLVQRRRFSEPQRRRLLDIALRYVCLCRGCTPERLDSHAMRQALGPLAEALLAEED